MKSPIVYELNMDGLVGPTHHYAGLSAGNIASTTNALKVANPAAAAHQGINKMRLLHRLGIKQAVLPPHQRPNLQLLRQLGFSGTPIEQIQKAKKTELSLLSACYSASSMWAANAATVSSSQDTSDNRVHFTAANLVSNLHRHQEANFSAKLLQQLFADKKYFQHHDLLPKTIYTSDEGAANHCRLTTNHHEPGVNLFVFGKQASNKHQQALPHHYPARQTLEASQAIARSHQLNPDRVIFAKQSPAAIDQGVFHNDVIGVANEFVFFLHQDAFFNQNEVLFELKTKANFSLNIIEVQRKQFTIEDAVKSYVFNSQLITLPTTQENKPMALIAPLECEQHSKIKTFIDELLLDNKNPITEIYYLDLKQSMLNGGGPACLRLRVPLSEAEFAAMHQGVVVNEELLTTLEQWVDKHYRTELQANDLTDPTLIEESYQALDELTVILNLGAIYPFQCENTM